MHVVDTLFCLEIITKKEKKIIKRRKKEKKRKIKKLGKMTYLHKFGFWGIFKYRRTYLYKILDSGEFLNTE